MGATHENPEIDDLTNISLLIEYSEGETPARNSGGQF